MIPLILQDSIDRELLQEFIDARREDIKKPMTQRAVNMLIRELSRLELKGQCPNLMLARSMRNGWQDVFEHESTRKVQSFVATHTDRSWANNVSFIATHTDRKWRDGL